MKEIIKWLAEALSAKDVVRGMTHYRVQNKEISATDGRITAAHPWPTADEFLVPGDEFKKVLDRMPEEPTLKVNELSITVKAGRFRGTVNTLPLTEWNYPGVDDAKWEKIPKGLLDLLGTLRPFISDNAVQGWATCVALENGWAYATNNIALAGAPCKGLGKVMALLPAWAVDFILDRTEGLSLWAWTDLYVAFKWDNGAWMRSQLVVGQFPERAAALVRSAQDEKPTQVIDDKFRSAFDDVAELAEDTIVIYADRIESKFKQAVIEADIECEVPEGMSCSIWGARFLLPALQAADSWSPSTWPKPTPFKGKVVAGYVVGRKG